MNFKPIFYVNGILLLVLAAAMVPPMLLDVADGNPDWKIFATAQATSAFFALALIFMNRQKHFHIARRETFLLTVLSWIFMAAFGALPFYYGAAKLPYSLAFFEAMSGITTTGSTVMTGLDSMPRGILLWRSILHWLGGLGFLVIALAVLPLLQVSGMQIFKSQSFSNMEKILPSAGQMAFYICLIYVGLSFICATCLLAAGMTSFEAIVHAMSALATGGFSTSDQSIGHFHSRLIDFIVTVFMLAGSLPFVVYLKFLRGDVGAIWHDSQASAFLKIVGVLTFILFIYLLFTGIARPLDALVTAAFTVSTLISTTGFVSGDYSTWGSFAVGLTFLLTFLGGCSGSTAGAIKTFRLQILWEIAKVQWKQLLSPHSINNVRYNGKAVKHGIQAAIAGFFTIYIAIWMILGVVLQMTGLDFVTAFTGSASAISNVGPGLGDMIGPSGTFAAITPMQAWIFSLAMLLGRIEFMALFVLLLPSFWRD